MDSLIIFLCFLFLLVVVVTIVMAAYRGGRKDGYDDGFNHGVTAERLRWHEVEMRAEDEMIRRALKGGEEWPEEIDTEKPPFMLRPDVRRYLDGLDELEEDR